MNKSSHRSESRDNENTSHDSNKGLKMKIKRRAPQGTNKGVGEGSSSASSSKQDIVKPGLFSGSGNGSSGSGSAAAERHDSNSNSSSGSSASSATAPKAAPPQPFENLKKALLEQEKSNKQKQHHKAGEKGKEGTGFSSMYAARGGASTNENSHKREVKSDPYEFNAKNEDRLASSLSTSKKIKPEKVAVEVADAMTDTCHVAIMTDPDCLGPCEPGTSVILEGIVWAETENGLLVVNVTWRGKTYVGTLLDATKHEWAPPTLRSDSPHDPDARTPRTRGKRGRTTMNSMGGRGTRSTRNSSQATSNNPPPSPAKPNNAAIVGEKRKQDALTEIVAPSPAKKLRTEDEAPRMRTVIEDTWYVCVHVDCNKRYKDMNALKYHQNDAHKNMLLSREQNSEHNKTHVRFSAQQNMAAQTDEKSTKEASSLKKSKKSKKSKKNKEVENMEIDQTSAHSENVNVKQMDTSAASKPGAAGQSRKSSPDSSVSLKQPRIQLTPLSKVQSSGATKTVTAPIVAIPLASQAQNTQASLAALSKEEKKRERKKRKREKKEKKLLLEQQQQMQQQKENGQKLLNSGVNQQTSSVPQQSNSNTAAHIMNRSPPDANKGRAMGVLASQMRAMPAQPQRPAALNSDRNKIDDPSSLKQVSLKDNSSNDNVHSPAYSDISDEGNDNVPVLENEVELAKKQQTVVSTAPTPNVHTNKNRVVPRDSNNTEHVVKNTHGPEPPNLTPVITHTGQQPKQPPQGVPGSSGTPQQGIPQPQQIFQASKDATPPHVNNVRNLTTSNANTELNRSREAFFPSNRGLGASNDNTKPSPNEMHSKQQRVANVSGVPQQPHPVFANYPPQGYNVNHVGGVSAANAKTGITAPLASVAPNQDRLAQQKAGKEEGSKARAMVSPNMSGGATKLSPKHPGLAQPPQQNRPDTNRPAPNSQAPEQVGARRHVDSNMNMQQKVPLAVPNGPPMPHNVNKPSAPSVADINKQVASLGNSEVAKLNLQAEPGSGQQHKRLTDGMSISERQSENEKILKENIELKTQMNDKDSSALYEQKRYAAMMQQRALSIQQQQQQQQQYHRNRLMEQASKPKLPVSSAERPAELHLSPNKSQAPPSSSSQPSPHPSVSNLPRRDNSPMPSPKTKAELKQGGGDQRKDNLPRNDSRPDLGKRPESVDKNPEAARAMKSPGPSSSMSSPAPPPGAVPTPSHYPYGYPGYMPHFMFPGGHYPMPYPALEMLQQHQAMFLNSAQSKAQDLRKLPDRKSPAPETAERYGSGPDKRESPAPMRRSPQIPHPMAAGYPPVSLSQLYMHNGQVPMMPQSPQQPTSKH